MEVYWVYLDFNEDCQFEFVMLMNLVYVYYFVGDLLLVIEIIQKVYVVVGEW